nr:hypothetical protein [Tanacetum cinerariifolium]
MVLSKILLLNVSSLVKAELYYGKGGDTETMRKEAEEEMLKGLLLNLSHALSRLEAKGFTLPLDMKYPDNFTFLLEVFLKKVQTRTNYCLIMVVDEVEYASNTKVNLYGRVVIADEHSWLQVNSLDGVASSSIDQSLGYSV